MVEVRPHAVAVEVQGKRVQGVVHVEDLADIAARHAGIAEAVVKPKLDVIAAKVAVRTHVDAVTAEAKYRN